MVGLRCLQVVLDKGQEDDWFGSPFICMFAALAVLGLLALVLWETMVVDDPIVDIPLLANPQSVFLDGAAVRRGIYSDFDDRAIAAIRAAICWDTTQPMPD